MVFDLDWYHGTHARFNDWRFPPPPSPLKPELFVHTAIFLTTDVELARNAGETICIARLCPDARVIDLRRASAESDEIRLRLQRTKLGSHCLRVNDPMLWWHGWNTGEAMRFAPDQSQFSAEYMSKMPGAQRARAGSRTEEDLSSWLILQNLTRMWIETIARTARDLGFDALVGNEIDSSRKSGPKACEVLFALTDGAVTSPEWQ